MKTLTLLVDPFNMSVTKIDIPDLDFATVKKVLSFDPDYLIEFVYFDKLPMGQIVMLVDEEGLYRKDQKFFTFQGCSSPFAGKALMAMLDREGELTGLPDAYHSEPLVLARTLWLGDPGTLEHNIALGLVDRPCTKIGGFGGPAEIIWEWTPAECAR